jgi:threonine dehydrogenase-like Zn-dependent dehydrogenase
VPPETIAQQLLSSGPIGLVAIVALFAAWKLAVKVDDIQERRVTDVEKVLAVVSAITAATDKNTEAIERLAERIGR